MDKIGGGGLLVAGIFLILFGLFIGSDFVEGLLDLIKWLLIILGLILGVFGLIQMFSRGGRQSSEY